VVIWLLREHVVELDLRAGKARRNEPSAHGEAMVVCLKWNELDVAETLSSFRCLTPV